MGGTQQEKRKFHGGHGSEQDVFSPSNYKQGLDLGLLTHQNRFTYIDGLTGILPNLPSTTPRTPRLKSHSLHDLTAALTTTTPTTPPPSPSAPLHTLIIDGLDFILASQPDITTLQLHALIADLRTRFANVVVTAAADSPLLHNVEASATGLEIEHGVFVRSLAHQSRWVFQLRPLETGFAKDVTGVVQISRGGGDGGESELSEGEWLYQVRGDGNVRVWGRGE